MKRRKFESESQSHLPIRRILRAGKFEIFFYLFQINRFSYQYLHLTFLSAKKSLKVKVTELKRIFFRSYRDLALQSEILTRIFSASFSWVWVCRISFSTFKISSFTLFISLCTLICLMAKNIRISKSVTMDSRLGEPNLICCSTGRS